MKAYLCIDLEATCFEGCTIEQMEMIEIGVVAVWEDGSVIDTFGSFVKPAYTEVSTYCTRITNISDDMLKHAPDFSGMIEELRQWLFGLPEWPQAWYSWGKYDLRQLELDAGPSRWDLPLPLPEHRNAKKLFRKRVIRKGKEVGLHKALTIMGLTFEGEQHEALDDAKNVARLFQHFHDPAQQRQLIYSTKLERDEEGTFITLPSSLLREMGYKEGDVIELRAVPEGVVIDLPARKGGEA